MKMITLLQILIVLSCKFDSRDSLMFDLFCAISDDIAKFKTTELRDGSAWM